MVLPVVLGVIFLVMFLLFFQYDRCLMEQDVGSAALYGTALWEEESEERLWRTKEHADALYQGKYIAWENKKADIRIEQGKLCVAQSGEMRFPLPGLVFWERKDIWTASVRYENPLLSPAKMIRTWRKLMGGK